MVRGRWGELLCFLAVLFWVFRKCRIAIHTAQFQSNPIWTDIALLKHMNSNACFSADQDSLPMEFSAIAKKKDISDLMLM
ncbi:hypothetical protein AA15669_0933 [Saccharibacter floricola DSM 15669]|uniref:Uncharacterized protein n=1 Tax=Saccharibacter floricola DSM 15669 TaxID=1123227 RepID=A0ABQ0NYA2_9PROT|nr:hypothetical protein AA15669_0933 [Saccharibacter floricola DSM 15669]